MTTQPTTCPSCGMPPGQCYNLCPNSAAYYSPEQERADDATYGDLDRWEGWGDPDPQPDPDSWQATCASCDSEYTHVEGVHADYCDSCERAALAGGTCLCTASVPDFFGQRDHIVNPDCPTCA